MNCVDTFVSNHIQPELINIALIALAHEKWNVQKITKYNA